MHLTRPLAAAVAGLSLLACAQQQQPASSPQELAYCARLSQLYQRYVGPAPAAGNMGGVTPDVQGGEAIAKCREGDAKAAIPTLERLLRNADVPLPSRT